MEETCGLIGQCSTEGSYEEEDHAAEEEEGGRIPKQKYASLFFCLFVCLSKENFNWNCLIFKRNIGDLIMSWGLRSPQGQVRGRLISCRHPIPPGHLG